MNRGYGPILAALVCLASSQALAQGQGAAEETMRERNTSVRERSRPEYEALGGRVGAFLVFPKVTAGVIFDDNVFATETNTVSDTLFTAQPSVQVVSQWSRHQVQADAGLNHTAYADNGGESYTNYNIGGSGRLDVDRFTILNASARYSHLVEPRTALAAFQNIDRTVRYDRIELAAGGSKRFNRVRLNLDVRRDNVDFDAGRTSTGALVSQDYRDAANTRVVGRADYTMSPDTFFFVKATYNKNDFDAAPPVVAVSRDSDGYEFTAGADFDLSNLLRGQVEAGYLRQEYDSGLYGAFTGLQVRGRVEYFPTQLTTITFTGERSVQDSGVPNAPGYLSTAAGVQIDHELFRNVILTARGDYQHAKYTGIDRNDDRYAGSLGGTYLLNRNIGVSLTYYYLKQQSGGLDRGGRFQDNRLMATTTLQY